jgi:hypothetical protein
LILLCIVLIGIAPLLSGLVAGSIANAAGCQLDESGVHPCIINGEDYGETLLTMAMMTWLGIASIPLAIGLFVIYIAIVIIITIVSFVMKKRKKGADNGNYSTA